MAHRRFLPLLFLVLLLAASTRLFGADSTFVCPVTRPQYPPFVPPPPYPTNAGWADSGKAPTRCGSV
jgi:hypothetical protein